MVTVYNWQIGREMEYPYEVDPPEVQFAAVFDLNKCIGCQTCTFACKHAWTSGRGQEYMFFNNVETKPYGFYPMAWDARLLEMLDGGSWDGDTYTGQTIYEAAEDGRTVLGFLPEEMDWAYPNIGEDEPSGIIEGGAYYQLPQEVWNFYLPRICNHCTYPACVAACPRRAIYKREEDGIVLVDQERCRGYRECVRACPYKKVMFNSATRVSEKCIGCFPRVGQGKQTLCVTNCIGRIRMNGWIRSPENYDPQNPVDFLVHERKVALPLYPQFGLQMNIYYIPPIHVPAPYLRQMFGPGVDEAIETYKNVRNDPELLAVSVLSGATEEWIETFAVDGDEAVGYDSQGDEIVRVPLVEPHYIRMFFDQEQDVYRHNIT